MKEDNNKIKIIADKYGVNTLYLFGSQTSGDTHKNSDYDFAVQFNGNVNDEDYFDIKLRLATDLGRLYKNEKVDILVLNSKKTSIVIKYRAIKTGRIIYTKNDIERSRLEHKLMTNYLDRKYYSDRYVKASLKSFARQTII